MLYITYFVTSYLLIKLGTFNHLLPQLTYFIKDPFLCEIHKK